MERTNNVKVEIDERMSHLTNKLYAIKHRVSLSFRDVRNALDNIHKDLVVVLIDKATGNIALVCKRFYASVINRELGQTITHLQILTTIRSSRPKVSVKRCSWKFRKIHRKTPVPESFCYNVAGLRPATLIKKRLWHRCFPMNFAKFLRTSFFTEHFWWLLLNNAGGLSANDMFDNNIRVLKVNSFMTEAVIL